MKKKIAVFLVFVLVACSFAPSAFSATTVNTVSHDSTLQMPFPDSISVPKESNDGASTFSLNDATTAFSTEYEQIYKTQDNQYYFYADANNVYPITRFDINLSDIKEGNSSANIQASRSVDALLQSADLPKEICEELQKTIKRIKAGEITVGGVTIFTPKFDHGVQPMANNGDTQSSVTYYYNVDTMYQYVQTGSTTWRVAEEVKNAALEVVGNVKYFSAIGTAANALQAFFNIVGPQTITGSYQDKFQIRAVYDRVDKWTYVYSSYYNVWNLGAKTQQGTIRQIHTLQYYWIESISTGKSAETHVYPNTLISTQYFNNPDSIARQFAGGGGGPWEEFVVFRLLNTSVYLTL